jgi:hypothetical protein
VGVGDPLFYVIGAVSLIGLIAFIVWARRVRRRLGPIDDDRSGRFRSFFPGGRPPGVGGESGPGRGAV